jgi:hypothetical protein
MKSLGRARISRRTRYRCQIAACLIWNEFKGLPGWQARFKVLRERTAAISCRRVGELAPGTCFNKEAQKNFLSSRSRALTRTSEMGRKHGRAGLVRTTQNPAMQSIQLRADFASRPIAAQG